MSVTRYLNAKIEGDSPQEVGIGAFVSLARVSEQVSYSSQAPTAYLEDGSYAQDHIINAPMTLKIEGVVSDKYIRREAIQQIAARTRQAVGVVSSYLPIRTASQVQRINSFVSDVQDQVRQIDKILDDGRQVASIAGNLDKSSTPITKQFIDEMERIHDSKQLIKIAMPHKQYDFMVITAVSWTRDNRVGSLNFQISAQKIRIAEIEYTAIGLFVKKSAIPEQTGEEVDKGDQEGEQADRSLLKFGTEVIGGLF